MIEQSKSGLAFHLHHDRLIEWCFDYDERVAFIKAGKAPEEQELRLRLFVIIPQERLPQQMKKAGADCKKAWAARKKARADCKKAGADYKKARADCNKVGKAGADYDRVEAAFNKAGAASDKAGADCDRAEPALNKAVADCMPEIIKLHEDLCPDCPWDGKTIFSKGDIK